MTGAEQHTEDWQMLPWKEIQRSVRRLQQRIYQAERRGDFKRVRNLQRLLLHSWLARCLAVREVTQDNRGKRTPGVDGMASLTPKQRMALIEELRNLSNWKVDPIRRVHIPKPGKTEKRGLGIPTMRDRAMQALVKLALEPEWEAKFEPNSYGFRPGRSAHDAIEAIFRFTCQKPKYALDADIEKCFDKINHQALFEKLNAIQPVARLVGAWLKAGIVDEGKTIFPETGTPQGGVASPLLANIALHGLEDALATISKKHRVAVIRYADDVMILCEDLETLLEAKAQIEAWLAPMGLQLHPDKTRITHTLDEYEGQTGFDFLGFNVRQYRVGKHRTRTYRGKPGFKTLIKPSQEAVRRHLDEIRKVIHQHRGAPQVALIAALNPIIRGWAMYHRSCVANHTFAQADYQVYKKLTQWAQYRHRNKSRTWQYHRYWQRQGGRVAFSDGTYTLIQHQDISVVRHVKVRGDKSPYDGDWPYWIERLGRDPTKPRRVVKLLKRQKAVVHSADYAS